MAGKRNEEDTAWDRWEETLSPGPAMGLAFVVPEVLAAQCMIGIHALIDSTIHTWQIRFISVPAPVDSGSLECCIVEDCE